MLHNHSLQLPTSLHTSPNIYPPASTCAARVDTLLILPTSNVREAPGLVWSRQLVWSCQCLHLQTRCACSSSSSVQPFHTTTPPLYTNSLTLSLSLSPSPSLTFCLALRASLLPHTTRYAGCYYTPRRTAPHRTVLTTTTPLLTTTPHSTLTTHHRRNTFCHRLGLSIRTTPPSTHPSIAALRQRSIHCRAIASCLSRRHYSIQAGAQLVSAHDTHVQKHDRRDDERGY